MLGEISIGRKPSAQNYRLLFFLVKKTQRTSCRSQRSYVILLHVFFFFFFESLLINSDTRGLFEERVQRQGDGLAGFEQTIEAACPFVGARVQFQCRMRSTTWSLDSFSQMLPRKIRLAQTPASGREGTACKGVTCFSWNSTHIFFESNCLRLETTWYMIGVCDRQEDFHCYCLCWEICCSSLVL